MLAIVSVMALALASGAETQGATAGATAQATASTDLKAGERKVKLVCKTRAAAGTRFTKKTCMELEAYKKQQDEEQRAFEQVQNRPMVSTAKGN